MSRTLTVIVNLSSTLWFNGFVIRQHLSLTQGCVVRGLRFCFLFNFFFTDSLKGAHFFCFRSQFKCHRLWPFTLSGFQCACPGFLRVIWGKKLSESLQQHTIVYFPTVAGKSKEKDGHSFLILQNFKYTMLPWDFVTVLVACTIPLFV